MEYILMSLFGGGTLDWEDISQTNYDWDDIFNRARDIYDLEELDINGLYYTILEMAREDFADMVEQFISDYKYDKNLAEDVKILEDFDFRNEENWDIWCNCLDTHITLFAPPQVIDVLTNDLDNEMGNIDDKIGFTTINIEEREEK